MKNRGENKIRNKFDSHLFVHFVGDLIGHFLHFNEQYIQKVHLVTSIFKYQVIISMLTLSLLSLKRFVISHYQS